MTIAFTGGGTGGHFYPLIAIAEALRDAAREQRLIEPKFYFLAPAPFDEKALFENGIGFVRIPAGKIRRYRSSRNVLGLIPTIFGTILALFTLFRIYPDVLVSKGGYGSVPSVIAARILGIPILIHESDSKPGRANLFAARFADKIAITFESAAAFFPKKAQGKIARTGIPVRRALMRLEPEGAKQYLGLDAAVPTVLILGGSQGSTKINEAVLSALPEFVSFANVIHQTGPNNFAEVSSVAKVVLNGNPLAARYHPLDYLSEISLQRAAAVAGVVISRAGSTSITEVSIWKKPSIIIPLPEAVSHDQRMNAYAYARTGAAVVIEEPNLSPHLLAGEAKRILTNPQVSAEMAQAASGFADPDSAKILANEVLAIALSHE